MITQIETLVKLVSQLGLRSSVPLDRNLRQIGAGPVGASVFIQAGDYFKNGIKEFVIKRTLEATGAIDFSVYRHNEGVREEIFTTTFPNDLLERRTFNNASALPEIIPAYPNDIWELQVAASSTGEVAAGTAITLELVPN